MIRAYSQRLLPPFSGVVQIAQTNRARAQSFDGISWEFHYLTAANQSGQQELRLGYALDRGYYRVAHFKNNQLTPYVLPAVLNATEVSGYVDELADFLRSATLPFPAADQFEYWLLDGSDQSPLALILSCCGQAQTTSLPARTQWTALPHSKMRIEHTPEEQARNEAPVNHRFQSSVAKRAGSKPHARWFQRTQGDADNFPAFLVREDWQSESDHELCQRYLARKAPLLLMLQGLSRQDRERMEIAAKDHALEVDQHYPLYPEINNDKRMAAIRVEARLRRGMQYKPEPSRKKAPEKVPLSKEMRILE